MGKSVPIYTGASKSDQGEGVEIKKIEDKKITTHKLQKPSP